MSDILQGIYDPDLHQQLDDLNAQFRDLSNFLKRTNTIPTVRVLNLHSAGFTVPTLQILDLRGRPIRAAYLSNESGVDIPVYVGTSGAGIEMCTVRNNTWRSFLLPEETYAVSFTVPANGAGHIHAALTDSSQWMPNSGAVV